jgi:anthranilate phosphoribosyltransferase
MLKPFIVKLVDRKDLTEEEAAAALNLIMEGASTPSQTAAFLTALRMKGETIEEITGFAKQMRAHAEQIHPRVEHLVDTCGTGGDVSHTFNISTVSAIVAAGAGVAIAKHGNRSVSSKCGSADLMEAFGVNLDLTPKKVEECINNTGFGFLFAPVFHKAMKYVAPSRREIGIRTVFNILGPLTNPAGACAQVLGVYDEKLTEPLAEVLKNLGTTEAMVIHGMDGLDEISISQKTKISHLKNGNIETSFIEPGDLGLKRGKKEELMVHNVEEGKVLALSILNGKEIGSRRDVILLNAAAAIMLGKKAKDLKEGIKAAAVSIDSGRALKKLNEVIEFGKA